MTLQKRITCLFLGIAVLLLAACSSPGDRIPDTGDGETPGAGDPLEITEWTLESFGELGAEAPVIAGSTITLAFEADGQAGGSGGCNEYGAEYEVQSDSLSFGEIIHTERACAEDSITQQEVQYFEALQASGSFELSNDRLTILYNDGQGALNFVTTESYPYPYPYPY